MFLYNDNDDTYIYNNDNDNDDNDNDDNDNYDHDNDDNDNNDNDNDDNDNENDIIYSENNTPLCRDLIIMQICIDFVLILPRYI